MHKHDEVDQKVSGAGSTPLLRPKQLPNIMPDYMLVFAITVLAHHPEFESTDDVDFLKKIRQALWFIMEPLMSKNDNFSFGFYKALVEKLKNHVDAIDEEAYNEKLWAVCDLAISLLFSKTTNFELKEFPAKIQLNQLYFKEHSEGEKFVNGNVYIPNELVYQPPKKAGAALFVTRKVTSAVKSAIDKVAVENTDEASKESESEEINDSTDNEMAKSQGRKRTRGAISEEEEDAEVQKKPAVLLRLQQLKCALQLPFPWRRWRCASCRGSSCPRLCTCTGGGSCMATSSRRMPC